MQKEVMNQSAEKLKSSVQNQRVKKVPERQCCGCNVKKPKKELVRVVRSPEGVISLDFTGKKSGRGAYVCLATECLKKAQKTKRLERNLECVIPAEVFSAIEEELKENG